MLVLMRHPKFHVWVSPTWRLECCIKALIRPPLNWSTLKYVFGRSELTPTLDQVGWEIPASSAVRPVGVAGPRMKLARRFAAEGAMRTNVVIVSTPSLAFSPSFVEALEPVCR
jgi:hypothetical protein